MKTVTNEIVTQEELGGASTHTTKSSVADGAFDNDVETLVQVRRLFDFVPLSNREKPPTSARSSTIPAASTNRSTVWSPTIRTSPTTCVN